MPRPPRISQEQLARELGVSQALVSLVLNGRRQGINPESYERIWAHALQRGYRPKGMRLAAAPGTAVRQVGVILRAPKRLHTQSRYFSSVQHGLHAALAAHGLTTTFFGSEDELDGARLHQLLAPGHPFQGVVLLGEVARPFLDALRALERRIVAVSARYTGLCHSVFGNEATALEQLVRHLHAQGHRRFGWLGGNSGLGRHEMRFNACTAALRGLGLQLDPRAMVSLREADRSEGAEAARQLLPLLCQPDAPTALICFNCLMAEGAVRALRHDAYRIPQDLSIVGADKPRAPSDDDALAVTGAGCDPVQLGEAAGRLLLASTGAADEAFTELLLPSELVLGETSGPAA
ncbi:MAG: LacI family DNA-binding transcriptional regulator [Opitutae bacterium]|nr:LacI family DNA-binding transcriptional regulator [Opitutae bacterium]